MHPEIDEFVVKVKNKFPVYFVDTDVLEVGSQDINGSVRKHFNHCEYLGIDLGEATGVDQVVSIIDFDMPNTYDVVISSEMLEHCKEWDEALKQMYINTKPGGLFILTCAGPNRHEHGTSNHTPQDSKFTLEHYRNISLEDFESALPLSGFSECNLSLERGNTDLYFWGIKKV
jgi:SAM-dependent methyltransferase